MKTENLYIARIETVIPPRYSPEFMADMFYPLDKYGDITNRMVRKFATKLGIKYRTSVLNFDTFPTPSLLNDEQKPVNWGKKLVNNLCRQIDKSEIGGLFLSFNITSHTDVLPNLAVQIGNVSGLTNLDEAVELSQYGCAAGLYSIQDAMKYCHKANRPAIVFTYDQCTYLCNRLNPEDDDFRKQMVSNLLFNDGGVGLLIIPEKYCHYFNHPLMKINDIETNFVMGTMIKMKHGKFLMDGHLKDEVPILVSEKLVLPFLDRNKLHINDVDEWSFHQGGPDIIKKFLEPTHLGLREEEITTSMDVFYEYGNLSAPSCLFVLNRFFQNKMLSNFNDCGQKGVVVGFGAGYYIGVLYYTWVY